MPGDRDDHMRTPGTLPLASIPTIVSVFANDRCDRKEPAFTGHMRQGRKPRFNTKKPVALDWVPDPIRI